MKYTLHKLVWSEENIWQFFEFIHNSYFLHFLSSCYFRSAIDFPA
jgi:hypothetical protein